MIKSLLSLSAMMAMLTLSASAQVTQSTTVTEVVPEKSTTTSTTTQSDSVVREVAPRQVPTVIEVVPATPPAAVSGSITSTTTTQSKEVATVPQIQRFDPIVAQRSLSITPQTITITPEQRIALDRTVTIESRAQPVRRYYNVERNVVIVEDQGQSREYSYVTVPVLFTVDTADLLDADSRVALEQTAAVIKEVTKAAPNALFDVEGHTSTEGSEEHNMRLSIERSKRIYEELTQRYGIPAATLTAHGYGQNFPMYPMGSERERQEDRRVLVVRTR